jgi:beta-lactamase regulating signal transducer with metallopeptidase domain
MIFLCVLCAFARGIFRAKAQRTQRKKHRELMLPMIESLNSWSKAATDLVLAILWQSLLLAGVVAGVCWLLRRSSPGVRYWLWQIVAIKLLVMPLWTLAIPLPGFFGDGTVTNLTIPPDTQATNQETGAFLPGSGLVPGQSGSAALERQAASEKRQGWLEYLALNQISWRSWLVLAWLVVVLGQIGRLGQQRMRLGGLLHRGAPSTEPRLITLVGQICSQLGLRRVPAVVTIKEDCSPFVCGLFRPVLVLPGGLLRALDPGQLRQVLLHELAHVKRRDLLWGWIPEIARMIYFFNPVAHWVGYRIRLERELACDQLAMALSGHGAADYAETLVQVVSQTSVPSALKAAAASSAGLDGGAMGQKP